MNKLINNNTNIFKYWMKKAIILANIAKKKKERGVGSIIVNNGKIIGEGYNNCILLNDPTAHAEIIAIKQACKKTNNIILNNSSLYVTLEPCIMCLGAIIKTRIKILIFGCYSQNYSISQYKKINNKKYNLIYIGGILNIDCKKHLIY